MSSYPLLLAGNDAAAFIFVCARVSLCVRRSVAEADKVALFYTWKTFQKKPLHSQNKEPRRTQAGVCVCVFQSVGRMGGTGRE